MYKVEDGSNFMGESIEIYYRVIFFKQYLIKVSVIFQWIKVLAIKPDNLNSVSGTHTVEGADSWFLVPTYVLWQACVCIHTSVIQDLKK